MYYRIAVQRQVHPDQPTCWQWISTRLSSLQALFQFLRAYPTEQQNQLRVFSSIKREDLEEQLMQENQGLSSSSDTAAHFLQKRLIHSPNTISVTAESEVGWYRQRASMSIASQVAVNVDNIAGNALTEWSLNSLERRRWEFEQGVGGDHDVAYCFVLPSSVRLISTWTRLLSKIQHGELEL